MYLNDFKHQCIRDSVKNFLEHLYGQEILSKPELRLYGNRVMTFMTDTGPRVVYWRFRNNYKADSFTLRDEHPDPLKRELEMISRGAPIDLLFYCEINPDAVTFNRWQIIDIRMVREIINFHPELLPPIKFNFGDDTSYRVFPHTLHPLMVLCSSEDSAFSEDSYKVTVLPNLEA